MEKLYLIRHGETQWNREKKYQGWSDIPLSEEGKRQALRLAERFQHIPVDCIYASPLQRAYDTALPLARQKGLTVQRHECFKEINFGEWEGHTSVQLKEKFGAPFERFIQEPYLHPFPGEGSFQAVSQRIRQGLVQVWNQSQQKGEKTVVIVSHGGIIRLAVFLLLGIGMELYMKTWIDNTGITLFTFEQDEVMLRTLNDASHLETQKNH